MQCSADARSSSRRAVLAATGTLAGTALAGCLGGGGDDTPDGTPLQEHPAAAGLADQPTLGPDPTEAEALVIAFEDPSCSRCRAFKQETVSKIESELVEPGRGAFVFRGDPVVYPWGEPATQALEPTYARSADAFCGLANHYFAEQPSFDTDNVFPKTREYLAANTDLDADAASPTRRRTPTTRRSGPTSTRAWPPTRAGRPPSSSCSRTVATGRAPGSVSFSVANNALDL